MIDNDRILSTIGIIDMLRPVNNEGKNNEQNKGFHNLPAH